MICKLCKKEIPNESVFCPNCGTLICEDNLDETSILIDEDNNNETKLLQENGEKQTVLFNENSETDMYSNNSQKQVINDISDNNINPAYVNTSFQHAQMLNNKNAYQQQPQYQDNQSPNVQFQQNTKLNYIDFYKRFADKKTKNHVVTLGVICIISAVASLVFFIWDHSPLSILDIVFLGVFACLILKLKKWFLVLPISIYCGIFTIIGLLTSQIPSGILAFIISIFALVKLKKLDDAYKLYSMTSQYPSKKI